MLSGNVVGQVFLLLALFYVLNGLTAFENTKFLVPHLLEERTNCCDGKHLRHIVYYVKKHGKEIHFVLFPFLINVSISRFVDPKE